MYKITEKRFFGVISLLIILSVALNIIGLKDSATQAFNLILLWLGISIGADMFRIDKNWK